MKNKEIQEERIKNYFIESAKAILKGEGIRAISARNVAERAGYSYATIYNYFGDIKELIFYCVQDFIEECLEFVKNENHPDELGSEGIKSLSKAYMKFFVQYPGIYELFFLERPNNFESQKGTIRSIYEVLDELLKEDFNYLAKKGYIEKDDLDAIIRLHKHMVHGMLLAYLNRKIPPDYKEFMETYDKMADKILR